MDKDVKKSLDKLKRALDKVKSAVSTDGTKLLELADLYDEAELAIMTSKTTPQSVKDYITEPNGDRLPKEYAVISEYSDYKNGVKAINNKNLKKIFKSNNLANFADDFFNYCSFDSENIGNIGLLESNLIKHKVLLPLIKMYKALFLDTSDTTYLYKIGDLYNMKEDYEDALENYLNYAEVSEPTAQLYGKLAEVFGKLGDEDSRQMCLEQVKMLGSAND